MLYKLKVREIYHCLPHKYRYPSTGRTRNMQPANLPYRKRKKGSSKVYSVQIHNNVMPRQCDKLIFPLIFPVSGGSKSITLTATAGLEDVFWTRKNEGLIPMSCCARGSAWLKTNLAIVLSHGSLQEKLLNMMGPFRQCANSDQWVLKIDVSYFRIYKSHERLSYYGKFTRQACLAHILQTMRT